MRVYTFDASGPALIPPEKLDVPSGPRIGWTDSYPLEGYWKVGDLIINSRTNAAIKSWACVEEGNPGVWEAGSSGGTSASLASDVLYDRSVSLWISTNVQDVLDEISSRALLKSDVRSLTAAGGLVSADSQSVRDVFGNLASTSSGPGLKNITWDAVPGSSGYVIQVSAKNSTERFNATVANHTPGTTTALIRTYNSSNVLADTEVFVTIFAVKI